MAEPLKNHFGPAVPRRIAAMVAGVFPGFAADAFVADVLAGYEELELTPRAWKIARALRRFLPEDYGEAGEVLLASVGPKLEQEPNPGMGSFLYLPHVFFVAEYGLEHFELSMHMQYELTQRFTAEFSIRPYLERHQRATLARLALWAKDPSQHVRRLVSEGTRPRLPWAPRLKAFQRDPTPVLALLELLKDDPELYVRRSVANNLNDIGKDHPEVLANVASAWLEGASEERRWLVRHALRSAVKRAEPGALAALGFGQAAEVEIGALETLPSRPAIGSSVFLAFEVRNHGRKPQQVLVDLRVHFVKANGKTAPKVFKLKTLDLAPGETGRVGKTISLAELTTRKHFPGEHRVEAVVNGETRPLGSFEVVRPGEPKRHEP